MDQHPHSITHPYFHVCIGGLFAYVVGYILLSAGPLRAPPGCRDEVQLPSGDRFIVPSNLYIIGTMNTADKSIALLDIALRRRFEFEPMYPKYDIGNIQHVEVLKKLNKQIISSKGHDFQIGHSYFMGDNTDLLQIMNKKVIPLLLEYYMNDEQEVKEILKNAGLKVEEGVWPLKIFYE